MDRWMIFLALGAIFLMKPALTFIILPNDAQLKFSELVHKGGDEYDVEEHFARTSDGYILGVHRLRRRSARPPGRGYRSWDSPVLLMHGIMCSSEDYIRMGRNNSLAYVLADEGFDVWVGNFRGNVYTSHVKYFKTDPQFWTYGYYELGAYDVPATMDTVRRVSGAPGLHYLGFSMGTTAYTVFCHEHPELLSSVLSYTGLAPVIAMGPRFVEATHIYKKFGITKILQNMGLDPVGIRGEQTLLVKLCVPYNNQTITHCMRLVGYFFGEDNEQRNLSVEPTIYSKLQPVPLHQIEHFIQLILTGVAKFDYGAEENQRRYGQPSPPRVDLTANRAPTALFYGKNDPLATPEVAKKLANELKKTRPDVQIKGVPYKKFSHTDFIWAKDVGKLLNQDVLKRIIRFSEMYDNNKV